MRHIKDIDVTTISNAKLFSLLLQFQSIVLGDLYILNFVQVEHSLNTAIKKVLKEITKDKSIDGLYSSLIQTNITTASGKERRHLYTIANKWRILKKFSLYDEQKVALDIKRHTKKYGYLYSAYGETPKDYQSFYLDFMKYFTDHTLKPKNSYFTKILHKESKKLLKQLNNKKLDILVPLLVSGGVFRDTNKAFLGQSTKYRLKIIKEVKRRTKIKETHITHYLLSEIGELLLKGSKVPEETISNRKKNGVTLTRNEDITITNTPEMSTEKKVGFTNLKGICASPGKSTGTCKVVYTKKDIQKVKKGDIMIAIGTDFDLIEAMHKSSAVITEEGGILSHASVVCREMQKPCCIGVKEATNILYDGLEVTVDATKGLIIPLD